MKAPRSWTNTKADARRRSARSGAGGRRSTKTTIAKPERPSSRQSVTATRHRRGSARGGFDVIHAADGEQTLAWCGRRAADVLVTDIRLPGKVDGWQIAERSREYNPDLPVIYATGFSPVAPRPVAGSLLLHKPFHPRRSYGPYDR
jgi:CheY-like chemotaxis protein